MRCNIGRKRQHGPRDVPSHSQKGQSQCMYTLHTLSLLAVGWHISGSMLSFLPERVLIHISVPVHRTLCLKSSVLY